MDLSMSVAIELDKGFRSKSLGEQLAAVARVVHLLHSQNGAIESAALNAAFIRFADAFKDGTNLLRGVVARAVGECVPLASQSTVATHQLLIRVLKVSHSNDTEARALTLLMLEQLAPLVHDHSQVHHVLLESLDHGREWAVEFDAAVSAAGVYAKLSSSFSSALVERLADVLGENGGDVDAVADEQHRAALLDLLSKLKATADTAHAALKLAAQVGGIDAQKAMTKLAVSSRFLISKQIQTLLPQLTATTPSEATPHILELLELLAPHAHVWTDEQLEAFLNWSAPLAILKRSSGNSQYPAASLASVCLRKWLELLETFAGHSLLYRCATIQEHATSRLLWLLATPRDDNTVPVRRALLNLLVRLVERAFSRMEAAPWHDQLFDIVQSALIADAVAARRGAMDRRLAKLWARTLCAAPTPRLSGALHSLCSSSWKAGARNENLLHVLCQLVDRRAADTAATSISSWAREKLKESKGYNGPLLYLSTVAGQTAAVEDDGDDDDDEDLGEMVPTTSDWDRYCVARTGFRVGRWRAIAEPALRRIVTDTVSPDAVHWIQALRNLAESETKSTESDELQAAAEKANLAEVLLRNVLTAEPLALFCRARARSLAARATVSAQLSDENADKSGWKEAHRQLVDAKEAWRTLNDSIWDADALSKMMTGKMSEPDELLEEVVGRVVPSSNETLPSRKRRRSETENNDGEEGESEDGEISEEDEDEEGSTAKNFATAEMDALMLNLRTEVRHRFVKSSVARNPKPLIRSLLEQIAKAKAFRRLPRFFFEQTTNTKVEVRK